MLGDEYMSCDNAPMLISERQIGKCHVCEQPNLSIGFCPICCHWFCKSCNLNIFTRAASAVKEWLGGPKEGCCGPNKE